MCFLQFSGVETEIEPILARSGILLKPVNSSETSVCTSHRSSLGIGWRRASRLCSVPQDVSGHKKESKEISAAERGITLQHSIQIFELTKKPRTRRILFILIVCKDKYPIACHFTQGT